MARKKASCADEGIVLFDHKDLALSIELILKGDPQAPYLLGQLLVSFNRALDQGQHGLEEMRKALATAVESAYLNSTVHRSALELYRLLLEGKLKFDDEPAALIKAVIDRNTAEKLPIADCRLVADECSTVTRARAAQEPRQWDDSHFIGPQQ